MPKRCEYMENNIRCHKKNVKYGYRHGKALYCKEHKLEGMITVCKRKICLKENCNKEPSYNINGNKPIYCKEHKLEGMENVKSKKCIYKNCKIKPVYNYEDKETGIYCKKHKLNGMINVKSKRCIEMNCNILCNFGYLNEEVLYCKKHKLKGMINIKSKRCIEDNCIKYPIYGNIKDGISLYCKKHKLENMVDTVHKICEYEKCNLRCSFGYNNSTAIYCSKHRLNGMNDIKNKKCLEDGCNTIPSFGLYNQSSIYCVKHKLKDMIDLRRKKCKECYKYPIYGNIGELPYYCKSHKKEGMIDVKHKLCIENNCYTRSMYGTHLLGKIHCVKHYNKRIEWRLNTCKNDKCKSIALWSKSGNYPYEFCDKCVPYRGYKSQLEGECINCNINSLILDEENRCLDSCSKIHKERIKYSENEMKNVFESKKWKFITDKKIEKTGCSLRRPDFIFDLVTGILIVENDENQHKSRTCECEQLRMIQLFQDYGGIPVHFIRFNPDKYKTDLKVKSLIQRHKYLCEIITKIKNDNTFFIRNPNLTVSYLFYDNWDNIWRIYKIDYPLHMTDHSQGTFSLEQRLSNPYTNGLPGSLVA